MGKKNKNNKAKKEHQEPPLSATNNPLLEKQKGYLVTLPHNDRENFFSNDLVEPERRAKIWMDQADIGSDLVDKYSWATPDERAMTILKKFSPIVEIGCGANAYWCRAMKASGVDVVGYDIKPDEGGKIDRQKQQQHGFSVKTGGPEVLKNFRDRTLFLCYPDEDVIQTDEDEEEGEPGSLGSVCLENFDGTYVIHVGELYGDTLSMDQAPWGRSSGPEFQERLASEYHCLLKAKLTNWLHVRDTISVWKRSDTCVMVFAAEDDDEEEEEVEYRHIPRDERLPVDMAAPCLAHLLGSDTNGVSSKPAPKEEAPPEVPWDDEDAATIPKAEAPKAPIVENGNEDTATNASGKKKKKKKKNKRKRSDSVASEKSESSKVKDYSCPW